MNKNRKIIILVVGAIILGGLLIWLLTGTALLGFLYLSAESASIDVHTDITKYEKFIGKNAYVEFQDKWEMDETIFPEKITDKMSVQDYKMVYYNPWDAQYLSYLVVQYDDVEYEEEITRLQAYESTEYLGYYGVDGFDEKYELVAMYADSYQGFVYALTDKKDTIIYVEIIFCNYYMDLDYKEYIKEEYLPVGFDATMDNPYARAMNKK